MRDALIGGSGKARADGAGVSSGVDTSSKPCVTLGDRATSSTGLRVVCSPSMTDEVPAAGVGDEGAASLDGAGRDTSALSTIGDSGMEIGFGFDISGMGS